MRYIIMCGGIYGKWNQPKQLALVKGEPIVARTIRLLKEAGISDIAISTNDTRFGDFGVPVVYHFNPYHLPKDSDAVTPWLDAFFPMTRPVCYLFGDVVFSPEAIKTIVKTETKDIEFFASAKPLPAIYPKRWAEPFAFKVVNLEHFHDAIERTKYLDKMGAFHRQPVSWELWQVIKGTPLNKVDYTNYTVINDYTCDVDVPEDIGIFEKMTF